MLLGRVVSRNLGSAVMTPREKKLALSFFFFFFAFFLLPPIIFALFLLLFASTLHLIEKLAIAYRSLSLFWLP